jgi:hypothetical protein
VAPDGAGGFVVVWASGGSAGSDTSSSSVQGQRFDSTGVPVGVQFQVNTYTTNGQGLPLVGSDGPAVAPDGTGGFVVVWTSGGFGYPGPDGSETSIHGQRYASAGAPIGGEFQVNTYTTSYQYAPAAGPDGGGGFVVMWSGRGMSDDFGVWGQRYDGAGLPVGSEFQINTYTTSTQGHPKVAPDGAGGFVVTWVSQGSSGSDPGSSIQGQRYSSAGAPVGAEFQVNTYTTGNQDLYGTGHAVAPDGAGGFVVTWTSFGSSGSDTGPNADASIQGQRYGSTGAPIGGQFQVNTNTMYNQYYPAVAPDGAGGFVVVWQSYYIFGFLEHPRAALRPAEQYHDDADHDFHLDDQHDSPDLRQRHPRGGRGLRRWRRVLPRRLHAHLHRRSRLGLQRLAVRLCRDLRVWRRQRGHQRGRGVRRRLPQRGRRRVCG